MFVTFALELFEEVASRAGNVDSAGNAALTVLDALDDAGGLGALGAIGALLSIHDLLTVTSLGNSRHVDFSLKQKSGSIRLFGAQRKVRRPTLRVL